MRKDRGDGLIALIDNPDIDVDGLREHVKGPDFPTGAEICGIAGIRDVLDQGLIASYEDRKYYNA